MRNIPAALAAHLQGEVTTLAVCWRVERSDGVLILGTEHDQDVEIASGTYAGTYLARAGITGSDIRSASDLSVDNLEVTGAVNAGDLSLVDLSAADIEAGLLDDAAVVVFLVNYSAPGDGQLVLRAGTIGNITRTAEGQYRTELRGLTQALSRPIVRTYSVSCDADLFDSRCGLSAAAWTYSGTVSAVTSRRQFVGSFESPAPDSMALLTGGMVTFTSGENEGFSMEIKNGELGSPDEIQLYMPMPRDIEVGDSFTVRAGCNKSPEACKAFGNFVNFRGHGLLVPGQTEILKIGGQE